jgi:hypothetical protein
VYLASVGDTERTSSKVTAEVGRLVLDMVMRPFVSDRYRDGVGGLSDDWESEAL